MPIGKNAIKRVSNNGYSKVASAAPDMENSTVEVEKKADAKKAEVKKAAPVSNKTATKKAAPKKDCAVKAKDTVKVEKKAPVKPAKTPTKTAKKKVNTAPVLKNEAKEASRTCDNGCINIGGQMPVYLL